MKAACKNYLIEGDGGQILITSHSPQHAEQFFRRSLISQHGQRAGKLKVREISELEFLFYQRKGLQPINGYYH